MRYRDIIAEGIGEDRHLYHATFERNLDDIKKHGLIPNGSEPTFDGYDTQGRLFVSTLNGAGWYAETIRDAYDEPTVIVRFPSTLGGRLNADDHGNPNDHWVSGKIDPECIEVRNEDGEWERIVSPVVTEAPITDIEVSGDGKSFTPSEKKRMASPKWRERVVRAFRKTPHKFVVRFMAIADFDATMSADNEKIGLFLQKYSPGIYANSTYIEDHEIVGQSGCITVAIIGNLSNIDRMPMTAWTLAHKIGHGISDRTWAEPAGFADEVSVRSADIAYAVNELSNADSYNRIHADYGDVWVPLELLTMNSARAGRMVDESETFPEMVAQYLVTGRVKLNAEVAKEEYGATPESIQKCEDAINRAIGKIFDTLETMNAVIVEI
jgi:hypothetical protein